MTEAQGDHPSVSAVVPTVNRPQMLQRAIDSILGQDYPGSIECVVVFDHVTPTIESRQVTAKRWLTVLENTGRPGLAANRNTGYRRATGVLVGSCDDDDEWLPGKVSAQVELMRQHPEASVVGCGIQLRYEGHDVERRGSCVPLTFRDFLRSRHVEVNSSSYLVRRADLLGRIGLIDEEIPGGYGEDYEWLLRASRVGPVWCVPEALARVHVHADSFFAGRWRTIIQALTYLLERTPEFEHEPRGLARIEGQIALAHAGLGERPTARRWAARALRRDPRTRQAWAALAVSTRVVTSGQVVAMGRRVGRGV